MKNGRCPKCQSEEVFIRPQGGLYQRGEAYQVQLLAKKDFNLITYVCADCGYVELHTADQSDARKPQTRFEVLSQGEGWERLREGGGIDRQKA